VKIAIVVHGRFHAFDLAAAMIQRKHDITVLTNYPGWAMERFGLPRERVRSFWAHGALVRAVGRAPRRLRLDTRLESALHTLFGRWARRQLLKERWDVIHTWSGISEELLGADLPGKPIRYVVRGSAHVRIQARLLLEEEKRSGVEQDRPTPWRIAREEREYALADAIVALSSFAQSSFIAEGVPSSRLRLLQLGTNVSAFRPSQSIIDERRARILNGEPLRALFVGTLSYRKGLLDLASIVESLRGEPFQFRFVGPNSAEGARLVTQLREAAVLTPKLPQSALPKVYEWGDVFIFPTIEDGFAVVLAQAAASALPILTTTNSSGPDLIRESENGWVLPIRSPTSFVDRLRWCHEHRLELAKMVGTLFDDFRPRDWSDVGKDFEQLCRSDVARRLESATRDTDG
jgi:glycosyltransferase involved in cell wall biosynthesis